MKSTLTRRIPQKYCRKGAEKAVAEFYLMLAMRACRLKNAEKFAKVERVLHRETASARRGVKKNSNFFEKRVFWYATF